MTGWTGGAGDSRQQGPDGPDGIGIVNSGPEENGLGGLSRLGGPAGPGGPTGADGEDGRGGTGGEGAADVAGAGDGAGDTVAMPGFGGTEGPGGPGGTGGPGATGGPGGFDELALRRLMKGAVRELEPREGTLDHLRRAVPARRARKRQAVVGVAAAVMLIGTAVPAFVHVAKSDGTADERPVVAGPGEQTQGGSGQEAGVEGGSHGVERPTDPEPPGETAGDTTPSPGAEPGKSAGGSATGGSEVPSVGATFANSPSCDPGQLTIGQTTVGEPDASGKVYGTFRVSNASGKDCAVTDSGTVNFQAMGAADSSKIEVVEHTAGDAAPGLPDPSQESAGLVLKPDEAYEVRFAWVPTATCPTVKPSPSPSPTDVGTGEIGGGSGGQGGATGESPGGGKDNQHDSQLVRDDPDAGSTKDGTVAVKHTPEPGAPTAEATIPNACAGTIYKTGVLNAS